MNDLPLSDKYRAAHALSIFQRLNWLDNIWTQYLDEAREIPGDDVQVLGSLTERMQRLLENSVPEAEWLRSFIAEREQYLNETLSSAFERYPLTNEVRQEIWRRFDERGGFAAIAQTGTKTVMEEAHEASIEIANKMRRITDGNFVPGDLPKILKCAILAAGAAAATFAGQYDIAATIALQMIAMDCV